MFVCINFHKSSGQAIAVASGNWTSSSTWLGGIVPVPGSTVAIATGYTVNVDINTSLISNLVIDGTLITLNTANSSLNTLGGVGLLLTTTDVELLVVPQPVVTVTV